MRDTCQGDVATRRGDVAGDADAVHQAGRQPGKPDQPGGGDRAEDAADVIKSQSVSNARGMLGSNARTTDRQRCDHVRCVAIQSWSTEM
jgi:hypothetical protein